MKLVGNRFAPPLPPSVVSSPSNLPLPLLLKQCNSVSFGAQLHALSFKLHLSSDIYIQTSLLSMYSSTSSFDDAVKVFDYMPHRTVVTWTAAISAFLNNNRTHEALLTFCEMLNAGVIPDRFALVGLLSVCSKIGHLGTGRSAHCSVLKMGVILEQTPPVVCTALVDMYFKCGDVEDGIKMFEGMPNKFRNVQLWNAMMHGLAMHGRGMEAVRLLTQMESECGDGEQVIPNSATFVAVLSGCAHSGLVAEGIRCFNWMIIKKHGIQPSEKHYGCMVDLLSRAGLLDEAFELVTNGLPFAPNHVILGTLLNACAVYSNLPVAEKVMEIIPTCDDWPEDDTSHYIAMSNLFKKFRHTEKQVELRMKVAQKPKSTCWVDVGRSFQRTV